MLLSDEPVFSIYVIACDQWLPRSHVCVVSFPAQRNVFADFEFNGDSCAAFDDMSDDDVAGEATVALQVENLTMLKFFVVVD